MRFINLYHDWRRDNVPDGRVYLWLYGDKGRLVVEVRRSDKLYLVTGYSYVGGRKVFDREFTHRYRRLESALESAYSEQERF